MTSTEKGRTSVPSKRSRDGKEPEWSQARSKRTATQTAVQSPIDENSIRGEQDRWSATRRASAIPEINKDQPNPSTALTNHLASFLAKNLKQRQEQDLSGLIIQASNDSLLNDGSEISKEVVEAISQEHTSACPAHDALLARHHGAAGTVSNPSQEMAPMPMDRYVSEDLAERYALLSLGLTDTEGEWARYFTCLCGTKDLDAH